MYVYMCIFMFIHVYIHIGNNDAWDKIVADSSAECIRLRREVDEWKAVS